MVEWWLPDPFGIRAGAQNRGKCHGESHFHQVRTALSQRLLSHKPTQELTHANPLAHLQVGQPTGASGFKE